MTKLIDLNERRGLRNAKEEPAIPRSCGTCRYHRLPDPHVQRFIDERNATLSDGLKKLVDDEALLERTRARVGEEPQKGVCHYVFDNFPGFIDQLEAIAKDGPEWLAFNGPRRMAPDTSPSRFTNCPTWAQRDIHD